MDILNSIKEWFSNLFGEQASNLTESATSTIDDVQQQASDAIQGAADTAEQVKSKLPGQQ